MAVEIMIYRGNRLLHWAIPTFEKQLVKCLTHNYPECKLNIRRAGIDGLNVLGADKLDKKRIEEIHQETWESADDWFYKVARATFYG